MQDSRLLWKASYAPESHAESENHKKIIKPLYPSSIRESLNWTVSGSDENGLHFDDTGFLLANFNFLFPPDMLRFRT